MMVLTVFGVFTLAACQTPGGGEAAEYPSGVSLYKGGPYFDGRLYFDSYDRRLWSWAVPPI